MLAKVVLARVRRERDEARSGRDAAAWGAATATRERDKARAERDAVHADRGEGGKGRRQERAGGPRDAGGGGTRGDIGREGGY